MDGQIIEILTDVEDEFFENGEPVNFKAGDLVRAVIEELPYGMVAHINFGCGQLTRLYQDHLFPFASRFQLVGPLDLIRRASLPNDHPDHFDQRRSYWPAK
ncbi:MAG: hypothetical protein AB7L09_01395 [Nitrospira sp.]